MAAIAVPGIEASADLRALLAGPCGFLLAAMRSRKAFAKLDGMAVQCLIVDDNREFLAAAQKLLERESLAIAGVASTSEEALSKAALLRPDVVLVDVSLGEESGVELAR